MPKKYIIGIDQSTQGTKAILLDEEGILIEKKEISHQQKVNEKGWVSHDPEEIYRNTIQVVQALIKSTGIVREKIVAVGISNQRETSVVWEKATGKPIIDAIVWHCARADYICEHIRNKNIENLIKVRTGMPLSPYFPASKWAWILENVKGAKEKADNHKLAFGTIDTWLIFKLTNGISYLTDYSNASRTQLYNIYKCQWDEEICSLFTINPDDLAQVVDSDSCFGYTDFEGFLPNPIPIHGVLGDSHAALFGQGCIGRGMCKVTYGTGSSIMMNIGENSTVSTHGLVTSLAWGLHGQVDYVLEGNVNYAGAVISWLKEQLGLITSPEETEMLCNKACKGDNLYLIPAFTGLGAPYWNSRITASLIGMNRTTGRNEIIRAGIECIAYQIADVILAMSEDTHNKVRELRTDGGPTNNAYLMQFQSDILGTKVFVPESKELSAIGVAYVAGISIGIYDTNIFSRREYRIYEPIMEEKVRKQKYDGWKQTIFNLMNSI